MAGLGSYSHVDIHFAEPSGYHTDPGPEDMGYAVVAFEEHPVERIQHLALADIEKNFEAWIRVGLVLADLVHEDCGSSADLGCPAG
jgi:hypothetical protein